MKHIMCDLETLDTMESAIVVSIGLVYFDLEKKELGDELYIELGLPALEEQRERYRTMSLDCFKWWCQQSDNVRAVWFNQNKKHECCNLQALKSVQDFFKYPNDRKTTLWGNGSTFDNVILRSYFKSFDMSCPWPYSKDFCYRTMKAVFANRAKVNRVGVHHNALDDAKTQAEHLIDIVGRLK